MLKEENNILTAENATLREQLDAMQMQQQASPVQSEEDGASIRDSMGQQNVGGNKKKNRGKTAGQQ